MTWELFYLICFGVGLVLTAVTLVSGGGHHHLHFGMHRVGHVHTGNHGTPVVNGFT